MHKNKYKQMGLIGKRNHTFRRNLENNSSEIYHLLPVFFVAP